MATLQELTLKMSQDLTANQRERDGQLERLERDRLAALHALPGSAPVLQQHARAKADADAARAESLAATDADLQAAETRLRIDLDAVAGATDVQTDFDARKARINDESHRREEALFAEFSDAKKKIGTANA